MGTSKTAVQNSGQSSFRISGIRTGMARAITEYKTEEGQTAGNQNHQKSCQTGWQIIGYIIQTGRKAPESTIAFITVTDHGIKGIDHLIGQHAGDAQQQIPEQGGNHTVTEVLSQSLQSCCTDFGIGQSGGVTADNAGYLTAAFFKGAVCGLKYIRTSSINVLPARL